MYDLFEQKMECFEMQLFLWKAQPHTGASIVPWSDVF